MALMSEDKRVFFSGSAIIVDDETADRAEAEADRSEAAADRAEAAGLLTPEAFGASSAKSDNTSELNAFFAALAGGENTGSVSRTYPLRVTGAIEIPSGARVRGQIKLTTASPSGVSITIGDDVTLDRINIAYTGAVPAVLPVSIGVNFYCNQIRANAAVESNSTLITTKNVGLNVEEIVTINWTRPIDINGSGGASPTFGGRIGNLDVDTYIRALAVNFADGWEIESFNFRNRASGASMSPGHNGVLIQGAKFWKMGTGTISDSGEHAFRIGGSLVGSETRDFTIDDISIVNPGGCHFKVNDTNRGVYRGYIGQINGKNNQTFGGRNTEFLRLTNCHGMRIGFASVRSGGTLNSCFSALLMSGVTDLHIGTLDAKSVQAEVIRVDDSMDYTNGPATGIRIGTLIAENFTSLCTLQGATYSAGDWVISNCIVSGTYNSLFAKGSIPALTGSIFIKGTILGAITSSGLTEADPVFLDVVTSGNRRAVGLGASIVTRGQETLYGPAINSGNVDSGQSVLSLMSTPVTAAIDAMGAAISFNRPGSTRRGAAVSVKQTGSAVTDTGIAFFVGHSTTASDQVNEAFNFRHDGDIETRVNGRGVIVRATDGSRWRINVSPGGTIAATSV